MVRHLRLILSGILMPIIIGLAFSASGQTITSAGDGFWDVPATWVGGVVPTNANSTLVTIASTHEVRVRNTESANAITIATNPTSELIIEFGGQIDVSGALTLGANGTRGKCTIDGTLQMDDGSSVANDATGRLIIQSGGVYRMNYTSGGVIPNGDFKTGSTLEFTGYSDLGAVAPTLSSSPKSFYNVTWNCPAQGFDIDLDGLFTTINGDFNILSTGSDFWYLLISDGSDRNITVNGNFNISNDSYVYLSGYSAGANVDLTVLGDVNVNIDPGYAFVLSGSSGTGTLNITGDFLINSPSAITNITESSGNGILNLLGNFNLAAGTLDDAGGGVSSINFNGAITHTFTNSGTISNAVNYTVATLSTLNTGTSSLTGTGNLTLNGTLELGSTDASGALQTGTTGGNIRVSGTRTYASGSTIIYNGTGAQFIGNGFPSGGDVNLSINNSNNVTLSTSLDIVALRTLNLVAGNIVIGTQTLTINGTVSGAGGIVGGPLSKMVIGGSGNFGTLNFSGSNQLLDFTINRTSTGLVTLGGNLEILGTLTQTEGELNLNGNTLTVGGAFARTFGTIGVDAASSIIINGSGTLPSGSAGITGSSLGTLTMNRSSTTLDASASVEITNLNLTSGTLNNGAGLAIASGGTITRGQQGSMTASPNNTTNAYNVAYTNTSPISTGPELPSSTTALANLTKSGSGTLTLASDITVNSILTFSSGTFNSGVNDLDLKGNLVSNAASVLTGSNVTFSGTSIISGSTPPVFGGIIVTGVLTPSSNFNINGDLTNNGTLNAGSATVTFGGTTNFLGAGPYNFNNVNITGTLNAPTIMSVSGNWSNSSGTFNRGLASNNVTFSGTTSLTGTTTFSSITITGTVNAPATLRVAGNFTNNGTFVAGTGTLLLNGSSVQSIAGTTATSFNNITVTNSANPLSVQVQSNQNIRGILTLSASTIFDADGSSGTSVFTLLSSDDEPSVVDAAIAELPTGAQVTGNVTVQRYMSLEGGSNSPAFDNGRIYRYISSPVASPEVSQIQVFNPVTGGFTGSSTCTGCTTNPSMFLYNETEITDTNASGTPDLNDGYEFFPTTINTETLSTGRGYAMFVWGNVPPVSTAGNAKWSVRNPINSGTIDFVATAGASFTAGNGLANDGWNLVGNPYPSTIDWDAASGWTKTGLDNTIYMKDNGALAGTYATYVGGIGGTNGGSRYVPIGQAFWVKATSAPTFQATESVKAPGSTSTFFRTSPPSDLMRVTLRNGLKRDEIIVYFDEDATEEFDGNLDAYKLKNDIFNLSTITPLGDKLAINGLPMLECSKSLNLSITDVTVGAYRLDFTEFESFVTPVNIFLLDKTTGESIDVKTTSTYEFQVTAEESSYKDRFELNIINTTIDPTLVISSTQSDASCKAGSVTINAEGAPSGGSYRWYENMDDLMAISGQSTSQFVTPILEKSTTYYVSAVSEAGCEGARVSALAEVTNFDDVVLSDLGNGVLSSSYTTGNQWYKDNVLIPGATEQTYAPIESGIFKVEATIESCTTSAERSFTVTGIEDEIDQLISIFPNPVENILTIQIKDTNVSSSRIIDMMGREIGIVKLARQHDRTIGTFDFTNQPSGVYLLQVSNNEGRVLSKRISKK